MHALWTRISPVDGKQLANKSDFNFFTLQVLMQLWLKNMKMKCQGFPIHLKNLNNLLFKSSYHFGCFLTINHNMFSLIIGVGISCQFQTKMS